MTREVVEGGVASGPMPALRLAALSVTLLVAVFAATRCGPSSRQTHFGGNGSGAVSWSGPLDPQFTQTAIRLVGAVMRSGDGLDYLTWGRERFVSRFCPGARAEDIGLIPRPVIGPFVNGDYLWAVDIGVPPGSIPQSLQSCAGDRGLPRNVPFGALWSYSHKIVGLTENADLMGNYVVDRNQHLLMRQDFLQPPSWLNDFRAGQGP